jgi:hypothetical protein
LLIRPKPFFNECMQSYILRVCRANGWNFDAFKTHVTTNVAPLHSTKSTDRELIANYLKSSTGYDVVTLLEDVWAYVDSHRTIFDLARQKICPACYKESNAAPTYWFFKSYLTCVKHNTLMVDSCWQCNHQYSQNSLIKLECDECHASIFDGDPIKVQADEYSQSIYSLFAGRQETNDNNLKRIKNHIIPIESELSVLKSLTTNFSNDSSGNRHTRRFSPIAELYRKQKNCSDIIHIENALSKKITDVIHELYQGGLRDVGKMTVSIKPYTSDKGAKPVFDALKEFVISCPKELSELKVGIKWLENLLGIENGELKLLAENEFPQYLIRTQGSSSFLAIHSGKLIEKYQLNRHDILVDE